MNRVKISLLVISVLVGVMMIILITSEDYSPFLIGPKGEKISFYSLMYRGLSYEGKAISAWKKSSWDFLKPKNYNYEYSARIPETNIEVASFSYKEDYDKANKAFQDYENLLMESAYRKLNFNIVNQTEKFAILRSSALENNYYFVYAELIKTGEKYFIVILKSNINEEELVKKILWSE